MTEPTNPARERVNSIPTNSFLSPAPIYTTTLRRARDAEMASNSKRLIDPIAREAKRLGYVARSALKLVQLDEKFRLLRNKRSVLDLGCAPGAWIQVVHERTRRQGGTCARVLGIDLKEIDQGTLAGLRHVDAARASTMTLDATEARASDLGVETFDAVLSDMMVNTRGLASVDAAASLELAECAVDLAVVRDGGVLAARGDLVVKILEGSGSVEELAKHCKPHFDKVNWFKPNATRSESREIYLVARGRKLLE